MNVFEKTITRKIAADASSVLWNYWDHEHLFVVHENYQNAYVLYEDDRVAFYLLAYRLPILSCLTSYSLNTMVRVDKSTIKAFNVGLFGVPICTTVTVRETQRDVCEITMTYKFVLTGWKRALRFFLPRMIEVWNQKVWGEDLPIKLRRHKVMRCGFKDFIGLPDDIEERFFDGEIPFELPIKRHKDSPVNFPL